MTKTERKRLGFLLGMFAGAIDAVAYITEDGTVQLWVVPDQIKIWRLYNPE